MELLDGTTPGFLAMLAGGVLAAGLFAGVIAGLLGVGGGIVIVPVLYHVFSALGLDEAVRMHLAVGTSLATIIPTSIRSMMSHNKRGAVDKALLKGWGVSMLVGVVAGVAIAGLVAGEGLMTIFATVALVVSIHMAFGREEWTLAKSLPVGAVSHAIPGTIGLVSVLMGIGGGTLGVPILSLFNYPIHRAVGTAAGFGLIISVPGTVGLILGGWDVENLPPFSLGYVNLMGFLLIVPATVLAAPWGVRLAHAISRKALRRAFAAFLAFTALRMYADLAGYSF